MQDLYSWSAGQPKWERLSKILANVRPDLNAQSNGNFDSFVQSRPEPERAEWKAMFSEYLADRLARSARPATVARNGKDPVGRTVRRIHVDTDQFVIYCADDAEDDDDACGLHYMFKEGVSNQDARNMRVGLCPIAAQIARLTDIVSAMRSSWRETRRQRQERERAFDLMARAMAFGFEGQQTQAKAVLDELQGEINLRRDSRNRMRYIFATTISFLIIVSAGMFLKNTGTDMFGAGVGSPASKALLINVLLFGALGAFFSVVYDIKAVKVHHAITIPEMIYAGAVRIPVGVIAAAVIVLLFTGGWMLGGIGQDARDWSLLLLGFLAGFSEMFVPNALKDVETRSTVAKPGGERVAT